MVSDYQVVCIGGVILFLGVMIFLAYILRLFFKSMET